MSQVAYRVHTPPIVSEYLVIGSGAGYTVSMASTTQLATFGSGCFWCSDPLFRDLRGVTGVTVGYAGGRPPNPTYDEVCSGSTGHAEAIQIEFDPTVISYEQLLEVFWLTHNPTTLNRQGNDVGPQYRSVIFVHDAAQQETAVAVKEKIQAEKVFSDPIVTAIEPFTSFYPAEEYHQNYYAKNPDQGYCQMIIDPKVAKFRKKFAGLRKSVPVSA